MKKKYYSFSYRKGIDAPSVTLSVCGHKSEAEAWEVIEAIRDAGSYDLWTDGTTDETTINGRTAGGMRFETAEPLKITYGENDEILKVEAWIRCNA